MNDRFYISTNVGNWEGIQLDGCCLYECSLWLLVDDERKELKGTYFIWG